MITGNPKFEHQSGFLAREMKRLQALSHLPGLWNILSVGTCPDGLCNTLPKWQFYSLGSGSDSAYEYLLKVRKHSIASLALEGALLMRLLDSSSFRLEGSDVWRHVAASSPKD